jgi:hypothetical protein
MQQPFKIQMEIVSMTQKRIRPEHPAKSQFIDLAYDSLYFNSVSSVSSVAKNKEIECPSH